MRRQKEEMTLDFTGGGVASTIGLGAYSAVCQEIEFTAIAGASIGALIAVCLAAKKTPEEIRDFLVENVQAFCLPVVGKYVIQKKVDDFLGNQPFKNLPIPVYVAITPLRRNFPNVITRENADNLTAGQVVALSATLPGLFLPSLAKIEGKHALVLDGGMILNPPLNPSSRNVIFSYNNEGSSKDTFWNRKRRAQEANAEAVFHPWTTLGVLGGKKEVMQAFEFGQKRMQEEKRTFLLQVKYARL